MLVVQLAFLGLTLGRGASAFTNGMQRLPAIAVHGSTLENKQMASANLATADTSSTNMALQYEIPFYMGEASSPSNPLAQLTARANNSDTQLLSTERFADAIEHMTCGDDRVQIRFESLTSFTAAQSAWEWVNKNPSRLIVLVTGGGDCAARPDFDTSATNRDESYGVTRVVFNKTGLTATLYGKNAPLGQLLDGHWRLQGSSSGLVGNQIAERDFLDDGEDSGDLNMTQRIPIPNIFNKQVAGPVNVSLDGVLNTEGNIHWEVDIDLDITDSTLSLSTTGVSFILTPRLSLSGAVDVIDPITIQVANIPLAGADMPSPLGAKLGVFLVVGAEASLGTVKAEVDASIELELALSDGKVEISSDGSPTVTGFHPTFSVHDPEVEGSVSLVSSLGPTVAIVFEATLLGAGLLGGVQLQAPKAQMTLAAKADSAGVCDTDHSVGVDLDVNVGAALSAIWAVGVVSTSTSSLKIYATSTPIFSTCTAFGPTVGGDSTTSSPTLSPGTEMIPGTKYCQLLGPAAGSQCLPTPSGSPASTTMSTTASPSADPGAHVWSVVCQAIELKLTTTGICSPDGTPSPSIQPGINPVNGLPAQSGSPAAQPTA